MPSAVDIQRGFFEVLFRGQEGYLCIATKRARPSPDGTPTSDNKFSQDFYHFPHGLPKALEYISTVATSADVYYCPHLFVEKERTKAAVEQCGALWSDLDTCPPDELLIEPTIITQTSENRTHALWFLETPQPPQVVEDACRRIAYFHAASGADRSGWDLTQLLRVPLTYNHKYGDPRLVSVYRSRPSNKYKLEDFSLYPVVVEEDLDSTPFPTEDPRLTELDGSSILEHHRQTLSPTVFDWFDDEPVSDWSKILWRLELTLFEHDLDEVEVYIVARDAACNKYVRDSRTIRELWRDVVRAKQHVQNKEAHPVLILTKRHGYSSLLSSTERDEAAAADHFVNRYIEWASGVTDAARQYHQAGGFTILSSLLSGSLRLPTSYGTILPNLWFMILADTTLTRKSTAMDVAMDLIYEVDDEAVLATDGSIEGMLSAMEARPGRPSIFLRDEFTGFIEAVNKKDYLAGMLETLTKLYDGKRLRRVLRKETIDIRDPILIAFTGGIKSKMVELLRPDHVISGFLPRFVVITAEADVSKNRPLGPPADTPTTVRNSLLDDMSRMFKFYERRPPTVGASGRTLSVPRQFTVSMTQQAWERFGRLDHMMVKDSSTAAFPEIMTPIMARLAVSGLKAAVLLAGARSEQEDVVVGLDDLVQAFYFVEQWREHVVEIVDNLGLTSDERLMQQIANDVASSPGVSRAELMRKYRLSSRAAEAIFSTLEQRGLIGRKTKQGAGVQYYSEV